MNAVPSFNPTEVIDNVTRLLDGADPACMKPWIRGFTGAIEPNGDGSFTTRGVISVKSGTGEPNAGDAFAKGALASPGTILEISELPAGKWTSDYKDFLTKLVDEGDAVAVTQHHTSCSVRFELEVADGIALDRLARKLRLETTLRTSNMHAIGDAGDIQKFENPLGIMKAWFPRRQKLCNAFTELRCCVAPGCVQMCPARCGHAVC